MITDAQTNFVYFSELLCKKKEFNSFCKELTLILDRHKINYGFLPETNDIWCRDFMPIQVSENKFIEYRYDPDYLQDIKERKSKSYPDLICETIGLKTLKSDIILDGGNVIKWVDKVILTDKIIPENASKYRKAQLIDKLKELFGVNTIILIPWLPGEEFGHADGMIRFINGNSILLDGFYKTSDTAFSKKLYKIIDHFHLKPIELSFSVSKQSNKNWGYINFLQMEDLIIVPQFGIEEDEQALKQIQKAFPEYASQKKIETINSNAIIKHKGVLNCISWNIKR